MTRLRTYGFTLIELLVVVGIISALLALVIPSTTGIMKGSDITRASETVSNEISLARLQAIGKNRQVEVRIYQYAEPNMPSESSGKSATWHWHALQAFELDPGGVAYPLGKIQELPGSAVIDENVNLSSILNPALGAPAPHGSTSAIPPAGTNYYYTSFYFYTDGSTSLSPSQVWFLTIRNINSPSSGTTPPANFATIQVNPLNGTAEVFRP